MKKGVRWQGLLLAGLASPLFAYPIARNPDQRPSFGFEAGGFEGIHVKHDLSNQHAELERDAGDHDLHFLMDLLFPLSEGWSLQLQAGINSEQTSVNEFSILPGTSDDIPTAQGTVSLRRYMVGHALFADPTKNPDRWPSMGLSGMMAASLYHEQIGVLFGFTDLNPAGDVQVWSIGEDVRLPLCNALTLLIGLSQDFELVDAHESVTQAGVEARIQMLAYGGGFRYYWVDHTLISNDHQINPDRWPSISLMAVNRHQTQSDILVTSKGFEAHRDLNQSEYNLQSEFRLPVTDYLTLRLGLSGGVFSQEVTPTPTDLGVRVHTPKIGGLAGFRWYFR